MKKNAFTLIELIGVIIILAILILVVFPPMLDSIRNTRSKLSSATEEIIYSATNTYLENNMNLYPRINGTKYCITLNDLVNSNLLNEPLKDAESGNEISLDKKIEVSVTNNKYSYVLNDSCEPVESNTFYEYVLRQYPELALATTGGCLSSGTNNYTYMNGCYLTGLQNTNYAWFNGFLYRIMGINEDHSIRLITEETITDIPYGSSSSDQYYAEGYIKTWLNNYFISNTNTNSTLNNNIVSREFCNEGANTDKSYRTTCTNNLDDSPIQKAGLITIDEYNLAGNSNSYLMNGDIFWTMSVCNETYTWFINPDGSSFRTTESAPYGVRPVVNINGQTTVKIDTGTFTNPIVVGENTTNVTGAISTIAKVGEYVRYAERKYRVLSNDNNGVKMVLDGYYDSDNDNILDNDDKLAYGTYGTGVTNCDLCIIMNENAFITWLSNGNTADANKLLSTTWYRGSLMSLTNIDFQTNLASTENSYSGSVGLIRIGEILSGRSATIEDPKEYWAAPSNTDKMAFYIFDHWGLSVGSVTGKKLIRPIININQTTNIISGNGTYNNPYQI